MIAIQLPPDLDLLKKPYHQDNRLLQAADTMNTDPQQGN
jgi:hypothetical protein